MKKIIGIGLILAMSAQCFYELGVIAYFQLNRDYIAEVLCINKEKPMNMCNGQCFLDKNLDVADGASEEGRVPTNTQRVEFPVFLVVENSYMFTAAATIQVGVSPYLAGVSSEHSSIPLRPPSVA